MERLGGASFEIRQHLLVNAAIGFDAPKMTLPVFLQSAQDVQRAASTKPGTHFHDNLRRARSTEDALDQKFPFEVTELSFDRAVLCPGPLIIRMVLVPGLCHGLMRENNCAKSS